MNKSNRLAPWIFGLLGLTAGLLVAAGVWMGRLTPPGTSGEAKSSEAIAREMVLNAGAGTSNDAFAVCTGMLDDSEGLFMLDFLTGELTCLAINPRTGQFGARMSVNVVAALGADAERKPRYLMTTGVANVRGGRGGNIRPASSVVYVVDANTGAFAAYSVPWNPNAWAQGAPLTAPLVLIDGGKVRNVQIGE